MLRGERLNELDSAKTRLTSAEKKLSILEELFAQTVKDIEDAKADVEIAKKIRDEHLRRCNRDGLTDADGKEIPEEKSKPVPTEENIVTDGRKVYKFNPTGNPEVVTKEIPATPVH